ncbi:CheR family methyltransferase [Niabella insulamsoli]|uniref:CheR family methyltransferase n=1 Tax=Niabella insulamsoli TaxID=3144874 RepID=UPI0031FE0444
MIEPDIVKDEEMEMLLTDIACRYSYDFTQYSRASLKRRLNRICVIDKFTSFAELRHRLVSDASYLPRFIEEITVNVTEMFRDPHFFKTLREQIFPKLGTHPFIRIWVAGCATGEEAFSLAILLKEANLYRKSLIYATDINPGVLEKASRGIFSAAAIKQYEENYLLSGGKSEFSSYYVSRYDLVKFNEDLSEKMIFSTHNLVSDASFNEFQLILCRNVLIYFDRNLQNKVFRLFDESLQPFGYLALGAKETLRFSSIEHRYKRCFDEKIWKKLHH